MLSRRFLAGIYGEVTNIFGFCSSIQYFFLLKKAVEKWECRRKKGVFNLFFLFFAIKTRSKKNRTNILTAFWYIFLFSKSGKTVSNLFLDAFFKVKSMKLYFAKILLKIKFKTLN